MPGFVAQYSLTAALESYGAKSRHYNGPVELVPAKGRGGTRRKKRFPWEVDIVITCQDIWIYESTQCLYEPTEHAQDICFLNADLNREKCEKYESEGL